MNPLSNPRRKQVDGQWYEQRIGGGWAAVNPDMIQQAPPIVPQLTPPRPVEPTTAVSAAPPSPTEPTSVDQTPTRPPRRKKLFIALCGVVVFIIISVVAALTWYQMALRPVSGDTDVHIRVTVAKGSTPGVIAQQLFDEQLIRSTLAFDIYTRLAGTRGGLQLGTYILSPSESTADIADHIASGKVDSFPITFYPGGTLRDTTDTPTEKKTDVQTALLRVGYDQVSIDAAFAATYDSPIFQDKPAGASLEGYVFGETYSIDASMTPTQVLQMTFDQYEKQLADNGLVAGFKKQGLNLYQGITLASIVQREMGSIPVDMPQVAQIFLKRYREGMPLGADATFVYAAQQANRTPSVDFTSPYNTRIHVGLPPGPIASPGLSALKSVAMPAEGDYVYFVSGDDNKTYFSKTLQQHELNTRLHCKANCSLF